MAWNHAGRNLTRDMTASVVLGWTNSFYGAAKRRG
jgi:hypothetical protein